MTLTIDVPAERWEELANINSCMAASSFDPKKGKPLAVKSDVFQGRRYTAFGNVFGPWGVKHKPTIWAYRLVPAAMYDGETTLVYHDEAAIAEGRRARGDHAGLVVTVNGHRMVCAERVNLVSGLPGTPPLSLPEAQAWRERVMATAFADDREVTWHAYAGHPVIRYHTGRGISSALLWSIDGRQVTEMWLEKALELDSPDSLAAVPSVPAGAQGQLGMLF